MHSFLNHTCTSWRYLQRTSTSIHQNLRKSQFLFSNKIRYFSNNNETIKTELINVLRTIDHPSENKKDIVYLGLIRNIKVSEKEPNTEQYTISIDLELDRHYRELKKLITNTIQNTMSSAYNIDSIRINMAEKLGNSSSQDNVLKNVKNIIAVSSCKGGVGKSSVAVNLAYTLSKMDNYVGIFDADIYGPSLPTMTGANYTDTQLTQNPETQLIYPIVYEGVKLMSFGYVQQQQQSKAAIMRGPMVSNVIQQLLFTTAWGELDYLIIDFPPGTSDIHLTLTQKLNINAAIVITTPQLLSLIDVAKGIEMFNKVNVKTVALIKNMTYYICKDCGSKQDIFGNKTSKINNYDWKNDFGIENTYEIPIYPLISEFSDYGDPIVLNNDKFINDIFDDIGKGVIIEMDRLNADNIDDKYKWYMDNDGGIVKFVNNKQEFEISIIDLRYICRCALCVDEMTNVQILKREDIDKNIKINHIEECGNYAVRIVWSDKHESIYSFETIKNFHS